MEEIINKNEMVKKDNNYKKGHGGKIGAALGAAAGALGTVMVNPLGRFLVYQGQDNVVHRITQFFSKHLGFEAGERAFRISSFITNAIMAYPAILPIAGGLIAAGVGALIGRKISKSRLKHKNMKLKEPEKRL